MNRMKRISLVIGMLVTLVGFFSSVILAAPVEIDRDADATVTQVAHWQTMNPEFSDSTVTQVAHWQTMNPDLADSTVTQVGHWQAMNPGFVDITVMQLGR